MSKGQKGTGINLVLISVLLLILLPSPARVLAGDRDFNEVVKQIESHYHAKRTRIPLFGLMKPVLKIVRPGGAKTLDLAVFENQDFSRGTEDTEFETVIHQTLSQEWQPLVRVHSRRDGERTYIYARESAKDLKLMIMTLEQNEAVVMQLKVKPQDLVKWLEKPEVMGRAIQSELTEESEE